MVENQTVEPMDRALAALSREPEVFCCDNMNPLELLFFQLSFTLTKAYNQKSFKVRSCTDCVIKSSAFLTYFATSL